MTWEEFLIHNIIRNYIHFVDVLTQCNMSFTLVPKIFQYWKALIVVDNIVGYNVDHIV